MEVQVTMELWWTLNMISLSCAVYIASMVLKLICKAVQDGIFAEELTIDNLVNCKAADISFQDGQGRDIIITDVKSGLATRIKETATRDKELARGTLRGRYEKGRFDEGNRNAEKFTSVEEEIYLLYLLCDNMQEVAELLGVCRQTVSKKIKQYKADNGL